MATKMTTFAPGEWTVGYPTVALAATPTHSSDRDTQVICVENKDPADMSKGVCKVYVSQSLEPGEDCRFQINNGRSRLLYVHLPLIHHLVDR